MSNLYELLTRKVYLSSRQCQRRNQHKSTPVDYLDEYDEEDDDNGIIIERRTNVASNGVKVKHETSPKPSISHNGSRSTLKRNMSNEPNWTSLRAKENLDEFDLLDQSNSYRRYRLLSAINSERARDESRAYFESIVHQVDRIKLSIIAFVSFYLTFSLLIDLIIVYEFDTRTKIHLHLTQHHTIQQSSLLKSITFGLIFPTIILGILVAIRWKPQRNHFSLNYSSSLFIISIAFILLSINELGTLICQQWRQLIPIPMLISIKCIMVGFIFIYLLYIVFDVKLNAISPDEAQRFLRLYLLMMTFGAICSIMCHLYFFNDDRYSAKYRSSLIGILLCCRVFISINCSVLFYLIWNGVGHLHQTTTISDEEFDDFLAYYDMNRLCPNQNLTLNCISLACQAKVNHHVGQLNEDNFSIRTINKWRRNCFAAAGCVIFSFAFTTEICQVCFTSIWSKRYYPKTMNNGQIFWAHFVLLGCLLLTRFYLLIKPTITKRKTSIDVNRELLGHYSWHRNCHKFMFVYIGHIVANLMQLYMFDYGLVVVYSTNIIFGICIGCTFEVVCQFITNYMTVTSSTIQSALMTAMCHLSLVGFLIYYLLVYKKLTSPLFYINMIGALFSMIIKMFVSRCQCLFSQNSFDLIEMQSINEKSNEQSNDPRLSVENGTPLLLPKSVKPKSSNSLPTINVNRSITSLYQNQHPHHNNIHQHQINYQRTREPLVRPQSHNHLAIPFMNHQRQQSGSARSSSSQLSSYQLTISDSNVHRKSSTAVIAYRIKYRLESIVSILK